MKTPQKTENKSTTKKPKPQTVTPKRKVKAKAKPKLVPMIGTPPCECCPPCATAASGVIGTCEDGACVTIARPVYFGVLSFDPNRPTPLPYWEKPSNFPAAELADLMGALVANMDAATLAALKTALGI